MGRAFLNNLFVGHVFRFKLGPVAASPSRETDVDGAHHPERREAEEPVRAEPDTEADTKEDEKPASRRRRRRAAAKGEVDGTYHPKDEDEKPARRRRRRRAAAKGEVDGVRQSRQSG